LLKTIKWDFSEETDFTYTKLYNKEI